MVRDSVSGIPEKTAKDILISCGLMHDESDMINDEAVEKLCGGLRTRYYDRMASEGYGDRAWRANGKNYDLILWDCGNGWYQVVRKLGRYKLSDCKKIIQRAKKCQNTK